MIDDKEKVYLPEVIQENPFPGETEPFILPTKSLAGTFEPITTKENKIPKKRIAVELLSSALNTRSRKILQEFALQQSGGFQIGDFKEGVSGDLRLTPNGLTARDIAGLTTFAIDGTDGSAFFKGQIASGSIMTEGAIVDENGTTIIDEGGLISSANFPFDTVFSSTVQTLSGSTTVDLTSMSLTLVLTRQTRILIIASVQIEMLFNTNTNTASFGIDVNGATQTPVGYLSAVKGAGENVILDQTITTHKTVDLGAGTHTIKLIGNHIGSIDADFKDKQLTYIAFGK